MEHLSEADACQHLKEVWRVLNSDGSYLFYVPSRNPNRNTRSVFRHLICSSVSYQTEPAVLACERLANAARAVHPGNEISIQRWSRPGAQEMLVIRSSVLGQRFDDLWAAA
jgi:hypothetical protein